VFRSNYNIYSETSSQCGVLAVPEKKKTNENVLANIHSQIRLGIVVAWDVNIKKFDSHYIFVI
jgi:hypothetical protein